jgi:pimeloyl-ACP methyl ester carboxylesterase
MPTLELPQGRVHYTDDGEGPAVVMLHGVFVNGVLWRKVAAQLHGSHRVIVPDLPLGGHPMPMRADADVSPTGVARLVADLLDALDLDDVTLVGNDTGGALAQLVAADHPQRVGRLALTNCDLLENFPPAVLKPFLRVARLPGALSAMYASLRVSALRNSPLAFGWLTKGTIDDELARQWFEPAREPGVRRDLQRFLAGVSPDHTLRAADVLARTDLPILLAWAPEDRFFTMDHARRFAGRMRNARIETIAGSYAFSPEDQPGAVASHIARFVASTTAPAAAAAT